MWYVAVDQFEELSTNTEVLDLIEESRVRDGVKCFGEV